MATVLLAVAFPTVALATAELGVFGIELLPHPDQDGLGRRGQVSIVATATAGSTVSRQVRVSNQTRDAAPLIVYVGGARVEDDGFELADGEGEVEGWATTSPDELQLEPGEARDVDVRIDVPADAPNGEHYGVVWLQPPASGGAIAQVNRVGIRIYLSVTGGVDEPTVDFTIDTMTAARLDTGEPAIRAQVTNTGERALDLVGELRLREGPGGSNAGPFDTPETTTVGIGATATVVVPLDAGLPAGPWTARLELSSGATARAAEATVTFPDAAGASGSPVDAEMTPVEQQRRVLIPLVGSLVTALLVITLVLLLASRRDRATA